MTSNLIQGSSSGGVVLALDGAGVAEAVCFAVARADRSLAVLAVFGTLLAGGVVLVWLAGVARSTGSGAG